MKIDLFLAIVGVSFSGWVGFHAGRCVSNTYIGSLVLPLELHSEHRKDTAATSSSTTERHGTDGVCPLSDVTNQQQLCSSNSTRGHNIHFELYDDDDNGDDLDDDDHDEDDIVTTERTNRLTGPHVEIVVNAKGIDGAMISSTEQIQLLLESLIRALHDQDSGRDGDDNDDENDDDDDDDEDLPLVGYSAYRIDFTK